MTTTKELREVFVRNQAWVRERLAADADYFKELAKGQAPGFLYIGCADSRVTAELVMGLGPGQAFIHRNIANLVNALDVSAMASIEYAVNHLQVKHIVVCGHYGCGGVKAAMQSDDLGVLNPWLRNIRDVYRIHCETLNALDDTGARYDRLVELNVQEQCVNVIKTAAVQHAYLDRGDINVHGWVFNLETGRLTDLEIDFEAIMGGIMEIYRLEPRPKG